MLAKLSQITSKYALEFQKEKYELELQKERNSELLKVNSALSKI